MEHYKNLGGDSSVAEYEIATVRIPAIVTDDSG
jgi:hypothetical protein